MSMRKPFPQDIIDQYAKSSGVSPGNQAAGTLISAGVSALTFDNDFDTLTALHIFGTLVAPMDVRFRMRRNNFIDPPEFVTGLDVTITLATAAEVVRQELPSDFMRRSPQLFGYDSVVDFIGAGNVDYAMIWLGSQFTDRPHRAGTLFGGAFGLIDGGAIKLSDNVSVGDI